MGRALEPEISFRLPVSGAPDEAFPTLNARPGVRLSHFTGGGMVRVRRFLVLIAVIATAFGMLDCGSASMQSKQPPPPPTPVLAYLHRSGIPNSYIIYDLKILR